MSEKEMKIIYRSHDRLCVERSGIVVHVEKRRSSAEARETRSGGPMSGPVVGRYVEGVWEVEAVSPEVAELINEALLAA